ncbi:hypothetical protein YC2023_099516 [Brassica napus]
MDIDSKNARLQVSIDADRPLQFNRRIGFPNGDTGKVSFEYEGLNRYCFACNRNSHDVYSCAEISEEERESLVKELREQNVASAQNHHTQLGLPPIPATTRDLDLQREKLQQDLPLDTNILVHPASENYWTARRYEERSPRAKDLLKRDEKAPEARISHGVNRSSSIWNRLEEKNHKDAPRDRRASNRSGPYSSAVGSYKRPEINRAKNHREDKGAARSYNRSPPSQMIWRPRSRNKEILKEALGRSDKEIQRESPRSKADSQQTISELPTMKNPHNNHDSEPRQPGEHTNLARMRLQRNVYADSKERL